MYVLNRGDFAWLCFDPQTGHGQMGNRPALVVSQANFNVKMGLTFVCPISNTRLRNPFYVQIPDGEAVTGVIIADQLRALDFRARKARFIGTCTNLVLQDVLRRIKPILF